MSKNLDTIFVVEESDNLLTSFLINGNIISSFSKDVSKNQSNGLEGIATDNNFNIYFVNEKLPGYLMTIIRGIANLFTDGEENKNLNFILNQNYQKTFSPTKTISYRILFEGFVKISILNSLGEIVKELVNLTQQRSYLSVFFNVVGLSSGIYFYAISPSSNEDYQEFYIFRKIILLK